MRREYNNYTSKIESIPIDLEKIYLFTDDQFRKNSINLLDLSFHKNPLYISFSLNQDYFLIFSDFYNHSSIFTKETQINTLEFKDYEIIILKSIELYKKYIINKKKCLK